MSGGGYIPDNPVDLSTYEDFRLSVEVKTEYYDAAITKNTAICKKNLVGSTGELNIVVQAGHIVNNEFIVDHEERYSIDTFIEKATGKQLNSGETEWVSGGTAQDAFFVNFSSGDENGFSSETKQKITFILIAQLSNGYESKTISLDVNVFASWYSDTIGDSIELKPFKVTRNITATIEGQTYVVAKQKVNSDDSYECILVSSLQESNPIPSGSTAYPLTISVDRYTGEYHFFISTVEVFGVLKNVYGGSYAYESKQNGIVVLFNDYVAPVDGESNIDVLFPCFVQGNSDKIAKCRVAKLFGNANAKNRLFVSGNSDYPNFDWHSGARNKYLEPENEADSNGDFTYFGDMDYNPYGQTDNAVMGYDIVATDKMIVLKSKSKVEPTNYFRTSSMIDAIDASGNFIKGIDGSVLQQESFKCETGNIGAGAMNIKSVINLNGDTLYLSSENTICGLNIAGQVGDSQRISYSRSRYIDPELRDLDLSQATMWTDNNYAYLLTSNAIYLTHYETFNSETNQYEWFKIDVKLATCAIDIDGVTFFGTQDGKLYRFEKDQYTDCEKIFLNVGATYYSTDHIHFNTAYASKFGDGKNLTFKPRTATLATSIFRRVGNIADVGINGCDLLIDENDTTTFKIVALDENGDYDADRHRVLIEELAEDCEYYLNHISGEASIRATPGADIAVFYTPYRIALDEDGIDEYHLLDEDGNIVDLSDLALADLCKVLDDEYEITDLDTTIGWFKIRENGRVLDIVLYADQNLLTLSFPSEIHRHIPVKSYFIAAPATLGSINYRKTIWAWTLSAFKESNDLQVCQATNEKMLDEMRTLAFADAVPVGLDFKKFSFLNVDFEKSNIPRKYTYFRPLSIPFIAFGFRSTEASNSILTATSIVYTIPMLGRGNE